MATFLRTADGYVMVFMVYLSSNWLMFFTLGGRMRVSWWCVAMLTMMETVAVYQILHYVWIGNIFVLFLFLLLFKQLADVDTYMLMYLGMLAVSYVTACNLVYYMIWGPAYTWHWHEVGWMFLAYSCTLPAAAFCLDRLVWPWCQRRSDFVHFRHSRIHKCGGKKCTTLLESYLPPLIHQGCTKPIYRALTDFVEANAGQTRVVCAGVLACRLCTFQFAIFVHFFLALTLRHIIKTI